MFSVRKADAMAHGFIPNLREIYAAIMDDTRQILVGLERRFKCISQQQFIFVTALDRCRSKNFEPRRKISSISQVQYYSQEVADNATDKRIFSMFLSLVRDLAEFRRTLMKVVRTKSDDRLNHIFMRWKKILEPRQDISNIRARFPNDQVNHLSCDEAKNHFGGIVSLIPVAMDCAREVVDRIESTRAYRDGPSTPGSYCGRIIHSRGDEKPDDEICCRPADDKPRPHFRRTSMDSHSSSKPSSVRNLENGDTAVKSPHGGWVVKPRPGSPALSSPAPSGTSSLTSIMRAPSQQSVRSQLAAQRSQPPSRPATADNTYKAQAENATHVSSRVSTPASRPRTSGKATQTPGYLASTLRPSVNWPHQSVSESEMRRLMHSRKHAVSRPNWKP